MLNRLDNEIEQVLYRSFCICNECITTNLVSIYFNVFIICLTNYLSIVNLVHLRPLFIVIQTDLLISVNYTLHLIILGLYFFVIWLSYSCLLFFVLYAPFKFPVFFNAV